LKKRLLVSIIGGSGSGKTTIIEDLRKAFPFEPSMLSMDNYYLPKSFQKRDENDIWNFDLPTAFNLDQFHEDVQKLINGDDIEVKEYMFENDKRAPEIFKINSSELIFIEGIFVLYDKRIREVVDHQIYIHANDEVRIERRLKRDSESRGLSAEMINYQWKNHVCPAHDLHVGIHKEGADTIIDNSENYKNDLVNCVAELKQKLEHIADA